MFIVASISLFMFILTGLLGVIGFVKPNVFSLFLDTTHGSSLRWKAFFGGAWTSALFLMIFAWAVRYLCTAV